MSNNLLDAIRSFVSDRATVIELGPEASAIIATKLTAKYVNDPQALWWWSALGSEPAIIDYEDSSHGLRLLETLTANCDHLILLVTDDTPTPWTCFSGRPQEIIELIAEQPFFELVLTDSHADFAIFDTHHDQLHVVGALVEAAKELIS